MPEKSLNRGFRTFVFPDQFSKSIWAALGIEPTPANLKSIAQDVLKMSDFYRENPRSRTPWSEVWCQRAQACYFLPLNYVRNRAVFEQGRRLGFFKGLESAVDVGSGLGAVALAAQELKLKWQGVEISPVAQSLSQKVNPALQFFPEVPKIDLVSFSYSLTEEIPWKEIATRTENLWITEPALKKDSRQLQELRQKLIDSGFHIWAPCTHEHSCPLLKKEGDWCHDRVHFQAPAWFLELESHLPMKNTNVAHSYLLASRRPAPRVLNSARVVGDYLEEKGKSRLVICSGPEKENLTWLHRHLNPPEISRGALVEIPTEKEQKILETRLTQDLKIIL